MSTPPLPQAPRPRVVAQLTIALMESGNVAVRGALEDLILAYGMLEMAKDAIRSNAQQQSASPLLLPPSALRGRKPVPAVDYGTKEPPPAEESDQGTEDRKPEAVPDVEPK